MSSTTMADLLKQAAEAGFGGDLPAGEYTLTIKTTNSKANKSGKQQIGVQWTVVEGPVNAGATAWQNQSLSPESPAALAAFFGFLRNLGVSEEVIAGTNPNDLTPLATHIAAINQGVNFRVKVVHSTSEKNGKTYNNVNFYLNERGVQASGLVAVAAPPVPQSPVAAVLAAPPVVAQAPAPVAPAVVPVAATPTAVVQPAVMPVVTPGPPVQQAPAVEPTNVVEAMTPEQLAQFQAWQAAQAAAQAAPVAAPAPAPAVAIDPATGLPARPTGI